MNVLWSMRTWTSTNVPAQNLKSSMPKPLIMKMWQPALVLEKAERYTYDSAELRLFMNHDLFFRQLLEVSQ